MADPKVALELRIMSGPGGTGPAEGAEAAGGAGRTSADIESEMRRRIDEMFNQLRDETRQQRSREREERVEREFNLREGLRRRRTQTQQQEREEQRAARQQQREEQIEREFNLRQRLREGAARPGQSPGQGGLRAALAGMAAGGGIQGGVRAGLSSAVSAMTAGASLGTLAVTAGAVTTALSALALAAYSVREAFQVSMLAPESAAARGQALARRIQSQRRMALATEEHMAEIIELGSNIEVHLREIRTKIVLEIAPVLIPYLRTVEDVSIVVRAFVEKWGDLPEPLKEALRQFTEVVLGTALGAKFGKLMNGLADWLGDQNEGDAEMTRRMFHFLHPIRQEEMLNQRFRESRRARERGERGDIL